MRTSLCILLLAAVAAPDDNYAPALRVFEEARAVLREPGVQARVVRGLEALVETGDKRAVRPLGGFLVQTMAEEEGAFDFIKKVQQEGAVAVERKETLEREVRHLKLKERLGDRAAGPGIEKRNREIEELDRAFATVTQRIARMGRYVDFLRDMRVRALTGAARIIAGLDDRAEADEAIGYLRQALDVAHRQQGLLLVRVLQESGHAETERHLIDVLQHPKADIAVRRQACSALGSVLTRNGADALVAVARTDPEGLGPHALHVLGRAAKRRLADAKEAAAWVATLPAAG